MTILREVDTQGKSVEGTCKRHKVSVQTFYLWRRRFGSLQENEVKRFKADLLAINDLLASQPLWDLVHIDVQGWEADICHVGMDVLGKRARRVNLVTHSRKLDGDLMELFHEAGWLLKHEKATQMKYNRKAEKLESMTWADGTQVWRNPKSMQIPLSKKLKNINFCLSKDVT